MAYDPEARSQSNSAMTISIVAIILLIGGALAYFATRRPEPDIVVNSPMPGKETVIIEKDVPANPSPPIVIDRPVVVTPPVTNTIERDTTVIHDRVVTPPSTSTTTNVTIQPVVPNPTSRSLV